MKTSLNFFRLLFFKGTCFKFYLIAVLICYLYFIINHGAHNILGTLWWMSFLARFVAGGLEIGKKCEHNVFPETLCSLRCYVGVLPTFKESCIINF